MKKLIFLFLIVISNSYCQNKKYNVASHSKFIINGNLTLNLTEEDLINSLGKPDTIVFFNEDPTQYKMLKYKLKNSEFTFNTTDSYLSSVQINSKLIPVFYEGINISIGQNALILKNLFPISYSHKDKFNKDIFLNLKGDDNSFYDLFINFRWELCVDNEGKEIFRISEFLYTEYD